MLVMVILFLLVVNIFFIPWETWVRTFTGFFQLSGFRGKLDWPLMGSLAATAGAGGLANLTITNWMRDKDYGMGALEDLVALRPHRPDLAMGRRGFSGDVSDREPGGGGDSGGDEARGDGRGRLSGAIPGR